MSGSVSPCVRRVVIASAALVWSAAVALGLYVMFVQETTAGETGASPVVWPAGSTLERGSALTIAMFVHPDCPCSQASIAEMATIAVAATTTIDVVFAGPDLSGALWAAAGKLARVRRVVDDGREAARFGALTSGYTVVYDRAGALRFAGGITGARGHVGDNMGRQLVERLASGRADASDGSVPGPVIDPIARHAVFGCALGGDP